MLAAVPVAILAAALCAWGALCLLFWQGSWQLLYHPESAVARTPASVGLAFDPVGFAATEAGEPRLTGWWIPAAPNARTDARADSDHSRYTVLYLHGQNGNLGDTVDDLAKLHAAGLNVLAFDYRGYGQSLFAHPSEAGWRKDTEWALQYLTGTRSVAANTVILCGKDLGANLAIEIGAQRPELAGIVLEEPVTAPMSAIFDDPRAHLVPARLLVSDRWDLETAAAALRIPSLWFLQAQVSETGSESGEPEAYKKISAPKMLVWLTPSANAQAFENALSRWIGDLSKKADNP
jgi:uncharacterized protein